MKANQKVALAVGSVALAASLAIVLVSIPKKTPPPTATPIAACQASVLTVLPVPTGKFAGEFADSLALGGGNLYERLNYGVRVWQIQNVPVNPITWDIEGRPGYTKTGDGFQTVSNVASSEDGQRVLASSKIDTHGTMLLSAPGANSGEWSPPRALAGTGIVELNGKRVGLALTSGGSGALYAADVTSLVTGPNATKPNSIAKATIAGAPGGVERSLMTSKDRAVYVTLNGGLVNVRLMDDGTVKTSVASGILASAAAVEIGDVVAGVSNGIRWTARRGAADTGPNVDATNEPTIPLPMTPNVVVVHRGVAYAWCGSVLYADGVAVLTLDSSYGPPKVTRAGGGILYVGTGARVAVVKGCR